MPNPSFVYEPNIDPYKSEDIAFLNKVTKIFILLAELLKDSEVIQIGINNPAWKNGLNNGTNILFLRWKFKDNCQTIDTEQTKKIMEKLNLIGNEGWKRELDPHNLFNPRRKLQQISFRITDINVLFSNLSNKVYEKNRSIRALEDKNTLARAEDKFKGESKIHLLPTEYYKSEGFAWEMMSKHMNELDAIIKLFNEFFLNTSVELISFNPCGDIIRFHASDSMICYLVQEAITNLNLNGLNPKGIFELTSVAPFFVMEPLFCYRIKVSNIQELLIDLQMKVKNNDAQRLMVFEPEWLKRIKAEEKAKKNISKWLKHIQTKEIESKWVIPCTRGTLYEEAIHRSKTTLEKTTPAQAIPVTEAKKRTEVSLESKESKTAVASIESKVSKAKETKSFNIWNHFGYNRGMLYKASIFRFEKKLRNNAPHQVIPAKEAKEGKLADFKSLEFANKYDPSTFKLITSNFNMTFSRKYIDDILDGLAYEYAEQKLLEYQTDLSKTPEAVKQKYRDAQKEVFYATPELHRPFLEASAIFDSGVIQVDDNIPIDVVLHRMDNVPPEIRNRHLEFNGNPNELRIAVELATKKNICLAIVSKTRYESFLIDYLNRYIGDLTDFFVASLGDIDPEPDIIPKNPTYTLHRDPTNPKPNLMIIVTGDYFRGCNKFSPNHHIDQLKIVLKEIHGVDLPMGDRFEFIACQEHDLKAASEHGCLVTDSRKYEKGLPWLMLAYDDKIIRALPSDTIRVLDQTDFKDLPLEKLRALPLEKLGKLTIDELRVMIKDHRESRTVDLYFGNMGMYASVPGHHNHNSPVTLRARH